MAMPDITEEEFALQIENQNKMSIQMEGFERWRSNQERFAEGLKEHLPDALTRRLAQIEKMKRWAEENGFMKPPQPPTVRTEGSSS
jgi:hypothetical protein